MRADQHESNSALRYRGLSGTVEGVSATGPQRGRRRDIFRKIRRHVRRKLGGTQSALLVLYTLGLLISGCGNSIYFKKMTNAMPNYGWFLSQVTCLAYVPIFGCVVAASISKGHISEEMRHFPKYKFALIGLLDGLFCLMCIVGGAFTTGPTQMVLGQIVVPVTLGLSTLVLGQRYHVLQYAGAVVIIAGVVAGKWPLLFPGIEHQSDQKDVPLFNILFAVSAVPGALSQVYKEVAFKRGNLNVNYMQYWVAVFQLLVGLLIAPLNALPFLGPQRIGLSHMPQMITGGSRCLLLGQNTIVDNCGGFDEPPCDSCDGAWVQIFVYLLFNVFYNVFTLLIVKHGGAALSFVVATLRLPLATLCFYSAFIMGNDATKPMLADFVGLAILVFGLAVYRSGAAIILEEDSVDASTNLVTHSGVDTSSLLPICEDDLDDMSEDEQVPIATLVVEPGPHILKIHYQRTRPLYLRPVPTHETGEYNPPLFGNSERPPRRRTMHDFREKQLRKIPQRRLPAELPLDPFPNEDSPCRVDDECLSDGSVNSLTGVSRPHPLDFDEAIRTEPPINRMEVETKNLFSNSFGPGLPPTPIASYSSDTRRHLTPVLSHTRIPSSVMLDGGLDVTLASEAMRH